MGKKSTAARGRQTATNKRRAPATKARRARRAASAILVALLAAFLLYGTGPTLNATQLAALLESAQTAASSFGSALQGALGTSSSSTDATSAATLESVPAYDESPYVAIAATAEHECGTPSFTEEELTQAAAGAFETYSALDSLGRCGAALACVGAETMPAEDEERGDISAIHPSGWNQAEYDFIDGGVLYNRCHLIAWALAAENDNERNLITGTRYLNVEGMLPFETQILEYIEQTGNHVLYRVTPLFEGDELVARGVQLEAWSVEDDGAGICFNVYCYNVQPGVEIDYLTGASTAAD